VGKSKTPTLEAGRRRWPCLLHYHIPSVHVITIEGIKAGCGSSFAVIRAKKDMNTRKLREKLLCFRVLIRIRDKCGILFVPEIATPSCGTHIL
jgi:hypothetical protein